MPLMKVNAVLPFNHETNLPACYEASPDEFSPNGKLVIIDRSISMEDKDEEFKLTLSMLLAGLAGMKQVPAVPTPSGRTNLIGKVKQIVASDKLGEQELIIVTDGLDNEHDINEFQVGVTDAGEPHITKVDLKDYPNMEEYMRARQRAILEYLSFIGAKVHLIGIGNEVKELLAMAGRHRMRVAHIPQRATATEVVAVVDAVINTEADAPLCREDFASTEEFELKAESRVITIDRVGCHPAPDDEQVQAVQRVAELIHVGERLTPEAFKEAFSAAEIAAPIGEDINKYTRGVVLYLMALSNEKGPIPGAVIGGKFARIFAPPSGGDSGWRVNQMLFQLSTRGILDAKKEEAVTVFVEGRPRSFNKVICYKTSSAAAHLVEAMAADTDWATPKSELVFATGKRTRGSS